MQTQVHLGLNQTTFSGESNSDFSAASRFSAGVGIGFSFAGGFFVQPELVYAAKGASAEGLVSFPEIENDVPVLARFTITYLEFPLLLGYQFGGESIRPRIYAGPYFAYRLKAKVTFESKEGGPAFTETDDSVVTWDTGFVLGAALHFPFGEEEIAVGARGSIGLSEITQPTDGVELNQSLSNRSIGIYVAILF
jgi:Outer membrane protein beta-barrel domain